MNKQLFIGIGAGVVLTASVVVGGGALFDQNDSEVSGSDNFNFLAQVALDEPAQVVDAVESAQETEAAPSPEEAPAPITEPAPLPKPEPEPEPCSYFTVGLNPNPQIIFNEIAWMGDVGGADHEWIEIKNRTSISIDISSWQIVDKGAQIRVIIPKGTTLLGGGFLVFKRGSETLPAVVGMEYSGALSNEDEGLKLFNKNCEVQDQALADPDWAAGEATSRRTMERGNDLTWHTYYGTGEGGVLGTPAKENSLPPVVQGPPPAAPPPQQFSENDPPPAPPPPLTSDPSPPPLAPQHVFYTSSHWKAKYYYCDTDPQWKDLSSDYLKSFPSEQELLAQYSRVLHEPCVD